MFSHFVEPIDYLDGQFTVRRIGDIFLLNRRINIDRIFQLGLQALMAQMVAVQLSSTPMIINTATRQKRFR